MAADAGKPDTTQPEPCQCMTSFAAVTNTHPGHCCFVPASQECHPAEVAEWERQRDRRWAPVSTKPRSSVQITTAPPAR